MFFHGGLLVQLAVLSVIVLQTHIFYFLVSSETKLLLTWFFSFSWYLSPLILWVSLVLYPCIIMDSPSSCHLVCILCFSLWACIWHYQILPLICLHTDIQLHQDLALQCSMIKSPYLMAEFGSHSQEMSNGVRWLQLQAGSFPCLLSNDRWIRGVSVSWALASCCGLNTLWQKISVRK